MNAFFLSLIFTGLLAAAEDKPKAESLINPPIKIGAEITISQYDPATEIFLIKINKEPAVGPNYAHSKDLWMALGYEGSQRDFNKNRKGLVGNVYVLKKELPMVDLAELGKKFRAKKNKPK